MGYQHEITSGLNHEQMEIVLRTFCILSFFKAQYDWDADYMHELFGTIKEKHTDIKFEDDKLLQDFKVATALWLEDNGMYSFAHRSLQEYFAASFVKHLNPKAKHNIYKKIIDHLSRTHRRGGEYENFLLLLKEMDTIYYYQFYYIPLLDELEKTIDNSSDEKLVKSFIAFFVSDYVIKKDGKYFSINQSVYKTIYIHIKFTQRLYNILTESSNFLPPYHPRRTNSFKLIPIDDVFFGELSSSICNMILKLAKEYHNFIIDEKKKSKGYLQSSINIDNEIIDMI